MFRWNLRQTLSNDHRIRGFEIWVWQSSVRVSCWGPRQPCGFIKCQLAGSPYKDSLSHNGFMHTQAKGDGSGQSGWYAILLWYALTSRYELQAAVLNLSFNFRVSKGRHPKDADQNASGRKAYNQSQQRNGWRSTERWKRAVVPGRNIFVWSQHFIRRAMKHALVRFVWFPG